MAAAPAAAWALAGGVEHLMNQGVPVPSLINPCVRCTRAQGVEKVMPVIQDRWQADYLTEAGGGGARCLHMYGSLRHFQRCERYAAQSQEAEEQLG